MGPARAALAFREGRQRSQRNRDCGNRRGRRFPEGLCGSHRTRRDNAVTSTVREMSLPFEVEPSAGNHMAWMNTIFGLQHTLMAA